MTVRVEREVGGVENMARDAALLERAEAGGIHMRVYSWDGPWVSLGRFQKPERALLDPSGTSWVMRPTGGKAVLHGHDATLGLAANLRDLDIPDEAARRVSVVYRAVVGPVVEALALAGVPAVLAEETAHVRSAGHTADCFAHVSPNDVVDPATGEKVCGCALRVTERAVLLQASIPLGEPLVDPALVFESPHAAGGERMLDLEDFARSLRTVWERLAVQPVF